MDETQQSRTSDAAATRKRRSSILKSQRPPRAPFSELEFNVTTPNDTAKSRRVSFSRRTGVAEFVTNEATTTWKNFYEEHNKTLESSGNESEVNAPRPPSVGHLGKRIFEDQFQEVEIIDYASNSDLNKVEYNNIDCTADDIKLTAPQQNFEFSALTATGSKLFEDNLGISRLGEITDNINVNFSVMQPIGDDLDEIQEDLARQANNAANVICAGPSDRNLSEYIEVDLNATQGGHVADDAADDAASDDMSITDTIHSPKVNVSKNSIVEPKDKSLNKDWVADKENIVVNPYIAPKEANNFAVNEESDKVLVFDGKRLTIQSQNEPLSDYRKTLLPNSQPDKTPQRKTIVLNVDDDLPNFVANPHASMSHHSKNFSLDNTAPDDSDISMTRPIEAKISTNEDRNQSVFTNSSMRVSSTALSNGNAQKRQTIVFESDDADISVTQVVTSAGILNPALPTEEQADKRKTIVFEDDAADISVTQAFSVNFLISENGQNFPVKRRTILYETERGNISVSEIVSPPASKPTKRHTIVFNESEGNISLTQAIPANLIMPETELPATRISSAPITESGKRKTIVFNESGGNISHTQAIPSNLIIPETNISVSRIASAPVYLPEKRKTIVFNESEGNISLTQAIPSNLIIPETNMSVNRIASAPVSETGKRKTIVFNESDGNISLTQAIPSNLIIPEMNMSVNRIASAPVSETGKRKTIVFNESDGNISLTQAIPSNLIIPEEDISLTKMVYKRCTINFNESEGDISFTQAIPSNLILPVTELSYRNDSLQKCVTPEKTSSHQAALTTLNSSDDKIENVDVSMTQAIPTKIITSKTTAVDNNDSLNMSVTRAIPSNVILDNKDEAKSVLLEDGHVSMIQAVPSNEVKSEIEPVLANMSVTQCTRENLILAETKQEVDAINENHIDAGDITMTEEVPSNTQPQAAAPVLKSESETSASSSNTTIEVSTKDSDQTVSKSNSEEVIENIESKTAMDVGKKVFALTPNLSPSRKSTSHPIPPNLISLQKDIDDLKKLKVEEFIEETELVSNFMVYQTAASNALHKKKSIEVPREESSSIESDTTESLTASTEHDGKNKVNAITGSTTSSSSDAAIEDRASSKDSSSKKLETANANLNSIVEMSEPSISSLIDKSCSNVMLCDSPNDKNLKSVSNTKVKSGILHNLLDMNDSFISSNDIVDKSVSNHAGASDKTPDTNASAETMFIITRDDEGIQTHANDEDDPVLKQDSSNSSKREKVCGTQENRDFESRRSVADSTADLLELISRFAEKGDELVKSQENNNRQSRGAAKRQSVVLSREDLMNNISMAQAMLQSASSPDSGSSDKSSSPERQSPEVVKVLRFEDEDEGTDSVDQVMVSPLKKTAFGESSYMVEDMRKNRVIPTYLKDVSDGIKALMSDLMKPMSDELPFEVATGPRPVSRNRHVQTSRSTSSRVSIDTDTEGVIESPGRKLKGIIKKSEDYERYAQSPETVTVVPSELSVGAKWDDVSNNENDISPTLVFDPDNPLNNVLIKPLDFGAAHRYNPEPDSPDMSREPSAHYEYATHLAQRSSMIVRFQTGEEIAHRGMEENASTNYNVNVIPNFQMRDDIADLKSSLPPEPVARHSDTESRPTTVDAGVVTPAKEFKSQQVNTMIAMQENKSLLLESSSLTLVESCQGDDNIELPHSPLKIIYKQASNKIMDDFSDAEEKQDEKAFMKRKYVGRLDNAHEFSTLDYIPSPEAKLARRSHSPLREATVEGNVVPLLYGKESGRAKNRSGSSPASSGRKTPESHRGSQPAGKKPNSQRHRSDTDTESPTKAASNERRSSGAKKDKRSPQKGKPFVSQKPNTNVMVQFSMLSEASAREGLSRSGSRLLFDEAGYLVGRRSDTSGSKGDDQSLSSDLAHGRGGYPLDWQPELINELSSKNLVTERENDVDVSENILNLPFMGTCDCKWEYCSSEEWRFLLLHERLRLSAALRPRPRPRADPAHVRADTPVAGIRLEATLTDATKGSAGALCVRFAAESMRVLVGRGCSRAGDVPALLRRCAGVSRVAARWGRAMHHAWAHLGYSLTEDGFLSLKVANIALRTVWEVTMNIEMTLASARDIPWPRATNVHVVGVVSNSRLEQTELQRALATLKEDWGHVPRTLWRIFKYLKKKTQVNANLTS